LLTVSTILIVVFLIRLIDFQIVRAEAISALSYDNRAVSRTVEAMRGDILDTNGNVLATSVYRYDINVAPVNVAGQVRKISGRVAMDQFIVDMGSEWVTVGDPVVVFGDPKRGHPSASDFARACGTIGYEIVTRMGGRCVRVYVEL
jgi:uncharacterized hydantoinase/oxoprolinase family protein